MGTAAVSTSERNFSSLLLSFSCAPSAERLSEERSFFFSRWLAESGALFGAFVRLSWLPCLRESALARCAAARDAVLAGALGRAVEGQPRHQLAGLLRLDCSGSIRRPLPASRRRLDGFIHGSEPARDSLSQPFLALGSVKHGTFSRAIAAGWRLHHACTDRSQASGVHDQNVAGRPGQQILGNLANEGPRKAGSALSADDKQIGLAVFHGIADDGDR